MSGVLNLTLTRRRLLIAGGVGVIVAVAGIATALAHGRPSEARPAGAVSRLAPAAPSPGVSAAVVPASSAPPAATNVPTPNTAPTATLPPDKQSQASQDQQAQQAAAQQPDVPRPPLPTPVADPTWPSGIQPVSIAAPLPASEFEATNDWYGMLNGNKVVVAGGAQGSAGDPSQGMVLVWTVNVGAKLYPTPVKEGAVTLTAANGARLTMTTTKGTTLTFDVSSGKFV